VARGVGESTRSDAQRLYTIYDLLYTERSINSYQLSGQSLFPGLNDARVEWRAATSKSTQKQPDFRTISYFWDFFSQQYAAASGVGNNRFFRDLEETSDEIGADFTFPFMLGEEPSTIKAGFNWMDGSRIYREKRYRWTQEANSIGVIENYPNPVGIVSQTENSVEFGNTIIELPNDLVNYDGTQTITAGYLMSDVALTDRFRAIVGVRAEKTEMATLPPTETSSIRSAEIDQTDLLPALSLVYQIKPGMNLRAAYGATLARPLYRELADIRVEDPFNDEFFTGNPDLTITEVDNYDLRWEWFPGGVDVLAAGVFYKDFKNPIEILNIPSIGSIQPQNLDSANVYGIEFEARVGLGRFGENLRNFSLGGNLALSRSEASIPELELESIRLTYPDAADTRELFGQSPYVFNFDATYNSLNSGTTVTAAFNIAGRRLNLVSSGALPDVYEQPAPQLDVILSQRLSRRWRVKVSAKNLLDSYYDKSLSHEGVEYFYERYRRGRSFGVSLSYFFE
jgi:TonB-dependent receptor